MGELPSDQDTVAGDLASPEGSLIDDPLGELDAAPPAPLTRGSEVGRYVILERVGAGGMGIVYAAWDPKLDRKVALKLLHANKAKHAPRLEREAQALARLAHPNVIAVHDVGEVDGRVFVAMEFVEGQTLTSWAGLDRSTAEAQRSPAAASSAEAREWGEILEVLVAAGRGLAAAHAEGLVHRDFKPDNVMIGADGRVRVMDFGLVRAAEDPVRGALAGGPRRGDLPGPSPGAQTGAEAKLASEAEAEAKLASESASESASASVSGTEPETEPAARPAALEAIHTQLDTRAFESALTVAGALLGTPAYMSPEQLRGDEADARSDQFAFCVVAWQCLYGVRPFGGDSALAALFAITHGKFREPETGRVVPSQLRRAIERGLAAEPEQRWPDVASLLAALLDDPLARRRPWLLAGASLAVAVVAATAAILVRPVEPAGPTLCADAGDEIHQLWSPARSAGVAEVFEGSELSYADETFARTAAGLDAWAEAWVAARRDACEATQVRGEQSAELLDLRMACLDRGLQRFEALVEVLAEADDTVIEKAIEAVEALPKLEVCSDRSWLTAAVRPPEDPALAAEVAELRAGIARVEALTQSGKAAAALAEATRNAATADQLDWTPVVAEASTSLGHVHQELGNFAESRAALEQGFFAARRAGHDEISIQSATLLIYTLALGLGEFEASAGWIEHAHAEADRVGRLDLLVEVHSAIGIHFYSQSQLDKAAEAFARSVELSAGTSSTQLAIAHVNYGTVLVHVDPARRADALAELELGLRMLIERLGPKHPAIALTMSNTATVYGTLDDAAKAVELLQGALEIQVDVAGADHPMTALIELNLSANLVTLGGPDNLARALPLAEHSLIVHRAVFGPNNVRVAEAERGLARTLTASGRQADALAHFDAAIEIWTTTFGPDHIDVTSTAKQRAKAEAEAEAEASD